MGAPGPDFDVDLAECFRCGDPVDVSDYGEDWPDRIECATCKGPRLETRRVTWDEHPTPALGTETMWDVVSKGLR